MSFTGIRDLDREIFSKLRDVDLVKLFTIDKNTFYKTCDDAFIKRRLQKYPKVEKLKREGETWKYFFSRVALNILKLKKKYGHVYNFGNFEKQNDILSTVRSKYSLLTSAIKEGDLSLVILILETKRFNLHYDNIISLIQTTEKLKIVKYLLNWCKTSITDDKIQHLFLKSCEYGHLKIAKYYKDEMKQCININSGLFAATKYGQIDIVKYLEEYCDSVGLNSALVEAVKNGNLEIVKLLAENPKTTDFNSALIEACRYIEHIYKESFGILSCKNKMETIKYIADKSTDFNSPIEELIRSYHILYYSYQQMDELVMERIIFLVENYNVDLSHVLTQNYVNGIPKIIKRYIISRMKLTDKIKYFIKF
jgi:hypothetical protein